MADAEKISDHRLAHRAVGGDDDAFAELARRYYGRVYSIAYSMLMNHAVAEDMTQDTFLRAYENLRRLRSPDRFASWIARIVVTRCHDYLRKIDRETPVGHHAELEDAPDPTIPQYEGDRDADLRGLVVDALSHLPEEVRTPTVMFTMGDASYAEIAEALHISVRSAEGRATRGLTRLRVYFKRSGRERDAREVLGSCALPAVACAEAVAALRETLTGRSVGTESVAAGPGGIAAWTLGGIVAVAVVVQLLSGRPDAPFSANAGGAPSRRFSWLGEGVGSARGRVGEDAAAQLTCRLAEATRGESHGAEDVPVVLMTPVGKLSDTRIVFSSDRSGDFEIYVTDSDGSNPVNVSNHPAMDNAPAWSPDGRHVVFVSERDRPAEMADLYVVRADGTGLVQLTQGVGNSRDPQWSPDGRRIVFFSDQNGMRDIYTTTRDGTDTVRLTHDDSNDLYPHWSPDGRQILFESNVRRQGDLDYMDLYVINADGTGRRNLMTSDWDDHHGVWSPDGRLIAFHSYRERNDEIYVMRADGTHPRRLTNNLSADIEAVFSPDGSRILFSSNREGSYAVYSMDLAGWDLRRLSPLGASSFGPAWSPFPPSSSDALLSGSAR